MNKCAVCGRPMPPNIYAPTEWEWFTGYLPDRVVFCPSHTDSPLRHGLSKLSHESETRTRYLTIEEAIRSLKDPKSRTARLYD